MLLALPVLWVAADLYLRLDLPGAEALAGVAFSAVASAARALDSDLPWLVPTLVGAAGVSAVLVARGWGRRLAPLLVAPALAAVGVAGLMERGTLAGIALGALLGYAAGGRGGALLGPRAAGAGDRRLVGALGLGAAALCLLWLVLLLQAQPSYALLADVGRWFREDGGDPRLLLAAAQVVAVLAATAVLGVSSRLLPAVGAVGVLTAWGAGWCFGEEPALAWQIAPVWLAVLVGARLAEPTEGPRWGAAALVLAVFAGLLLGQAYALRMLRCPAVPGVDRIATTSQLFRVALTEDGAAALLANRFDGTLSRLPLLPEVGDVTPVDGSAIPASASFPVEGATLPGFPEELERLPDGSFVSTLVTLYGYTNPGIQAAGGCPDPGDFGSLVVHIDPQGARVTRALTLPGSCWVGAVGWDPVEERLLMGWEYEAGLHVVDPRDWSSRAVPFTAAPHGDIGEVEVTGDGRIFMTSLWGASGLAELGRDGLQPVRALPLGGANYDLVIDEERGRAFVVGFYTSRVYVVDLATWSVERTLPTGLGARALAIDPDRGLLLVSSIYDGTVRLVDLVTLEPLAAVRVGGHVKDIAVDRLRGLAYGWSQCGLLRFDLDALRGGA